MDKQQVEEFYREIGELCRKYNIQGLVGMWFAGKADNYGLIVIHDLTDTDMKTICTFIGEKIINWADGIHKGADEHFIKEVSDQDKQQN